MNLRNRLDRVELQYIRQLTAAAGGPYGLTADDVLAEARRLFALSEEEQRAALQKVYDELDAHDARALDGIRATYARILLGVHR